MNSRKEPIKNWKMWVVLGIIFILSVPWYFPAGSYEPLILGIPLWGIIVIIDSLVLSAALTYILRHLWKMEDSDEVVAEEEK